MKMKRQSGVSLLEVMVAMFILGFGLLGLSATQSKNITMNQSVFYRSIAVDLGNDLGDRIRAIRTPYMVSTGANPAPAKPPDFSKCSPTPASCANQDGDRASYQALVNSEMIEWNGILTSQLPGASFTLASTASSSTDYFRYVLTITWLDNRKEASNTSYSVVIE
ncbi:type IV pilus modification protein PilV [Undibacterium sp. Ren11W]|uniref:type IV pilus modification protein PilV n=1 Tax=Undibacterium sp. Ren11W TaxID=3413045 RepID=UPI003BF3CD88